MLKKNKFRNKILILTTKHLYTYITILTDIRIIVENRSIKNVFVNIRFINIDFILSKLIFSIYESEKF